MSGIATIKQLEFWNLMYPVLIYNTGQGHRTKMEPGLDACVSNQHFFHFLRR